MTQKSNVVKRHWCMCEKIAFVARDGFSTCSLCGGKDAYGRSKSRPINKQKRIEPKYPIN